MKILYGVFQRDGCYIEGTMRRGRSRAMHAFRDDCGSKGWGVLRDLGYRVAPITRDERGRVKARPPEGPGFVLPRIEHQNQPKDLVQMLVAQLKVYRQLNHHRSSD